MSRPKRIGLTINEELHKKLRILAAQNCTTITDLVLEALKKTYTTLEVTIEKAKRDPA